MTNWTHVSENGMATSNDPISGGIVDQAIVSGEWFVVPNSDDIGFMDGFATKQDAMAALQAAVTSTYVLA